jgi:sterol 3beta-glucosyltransferase
LLTEERLARAIRAALEPDVVARAQAVGERIRAEDGAARAVDLLERIRSGASAAAVVAVPLR